MTHSLGINIWKANAVRAWFAYHGTTSTWEFINTLLGETIMNIFDYVKRDYPARLNDIIRVCIEKVSGQKHLFLSMILGSQTQKRQFYDAWM